MNVTRPCNCRNCFTFVRITHSITTKSKIGRQLSYCCMQDAILRAPRVDSFPGKLKHESTVSRFQDACRKHVSKGNMPCMPLNFEKHPHLPLRCLRDCKLCKLTHLCHAYCLGTLSRKQECRLRLVISKLLFSSTLQGKAALRQAIGIA